MSYAIREIFATVQGEGLRAGTRAVFVRFAGCNLWDGLPEHRDRGAGPCARWCDTDFARGDKLTIEQLLEAMNAHYVSEADRDDNWCVLTGGEPSLQVDRELVDALHGDGWRIAVETNGTRASDPILMCDHICLSPKLGTPWHTLGTADEVKVILPGAAPGERGWTPDDLYKIEQWATFGRPRPIALLVQPQDPVDLSTVEATHLKGRLPLAAGDAYQTALRQCLDLVMMRPAWRLSLQSHKLIGMP